MKIIIYVALIIVFGDRDYSSGDCENVCNYALRLLTSRQSIYFNHIYNFLMRLHLLTGHHWPHSILFLAHIFPSRNENIV